jgi:hypothetical protein
MGIVIVVEQILVGVLCVGRIVFILWVLILNFDNL